MNWYTSKLVYQIISGDGNHTPQFDTQIKLINASSAGNAMDKARNMGIEGQNESIKNTDETNAVVWKFIGVAELNAIEELKDGLELSSRIEEVDDANNYIYMIKEKSVLLQLNLNQQAVLM